VFSSTLKNLLFAPLGLGQQFALRGGKSRNLFFNRKGIALDKKSPAMIKVNVCFYEICLEFACHFVNYSFCVIKNENLPLFSRKLHITW
jgi:hypothetical protein